MTVNETGILFAHFIVRKSCILTFRQVKWAEWSEPVIIVIIKIRSHTTQVISYHKPLPHLIWSHFCGLGFWGLVHGYGWQIWSAELTLESLTLFYPTKQHHISVIIISSSSFNFAHCSCKFLCMDHACLGLMDGVRDSGLAESLVLVKCWTKKDETRAGPGDCDVITL